MGMNNKSKKRESVMVENNEVVSYIKIIIAILLILGVVYLITFLLNKNGLFQKGYTAPTISDAIINYDELLLGSVFEKGNGTYYVYLDNLTEITNVQTYNKVSNYKGDTPLYFVNMQSSFNSKYISEASNKNAKNASELKITVPTLLKISNGKIVSYLDTLDSITGEL